MTYEVSPLNRDLGFTAGWWQLVWRAPIGEPIVVGLFGKRDHAEYAKVAFEARDAIPFPLPPASPEVQ